MKNFLFLCLSLWLVCLPAQGEVQTHYYVTVFANQPAGVRPVRQNHTYAAFSKATSGSDTAALQTPQEWSLESFAISWLPARLPICLVCGPVTGHNYTLEQTFQIAMEAGVRIYALPTIEITKELYESAVQQYGRLTSGQVSYVLNDRLTRPSAINCVHAVVDTNLSRGYVLTGLAHGLDGSRVTLNHLSQFEYRGTEIPIWLNASLGMDRYPIYYVGR